MVLVFFFHSILNAGEGRPGTLIGQIGPAGPRQSSLNQEHMHVLRCCAHAAVMYGGVVRALAVRSTRRRFNFFFFFPLVLKAVGAVASAFLGESQLKCGEKCEEAWREEWGGGARTGKLPEKYQIK